MGAQQRQLARRQSYARGYGRANSQRQIETARRRRRKRSCAAKMLCAAAAALTVFACIFFVHLDVSALEGQQSQGISSSIESEADWRIVLVNDAHPMDPYKPELTQLRYGEAVDSRCYPDLQRMFDDMRVAGLDPKVNSSYRSRQDQQQILDETIASYMADGLSRSSASEKALKTVAEPGTSEHETGLAIDVTSESQGSDDKEDVWNWMVEHSWEYGWILRYPAGKEHITGIDNEPWHFRYVGAEAARAMHERGQCLEEYLGQT